jgi:hypothetical protein
MADHVYYVGNLQALVHNVCKDLVNKAIHIFSKSSHNLTPVLNAFGGDAVTATAALNAAGEAAAVGAADGLATFNVVVQGISVTVEGKVIGGVFYLGTAFI